MGLSTLGSIATHITESLSVPVGISGNMVEIVDMARQHVANYTGTEIGSNSIKVKFQPAIVQYAKADTIDFINAQGNNGTLKLDDLSMEDSFSKDSAQAYRQMADNYLKTLGRSFNISKTLV